MVLQKVSPVAISRDGMLVREVGRKVATSYMYIYRLENISKRLEMLL